MPTPLTHCGVALALAYGLRLTRLEAGMLVIAANAADLDFVPGLLLGDAVAYHHGASHSVVAAMIIAGVLTAIGGVRGGAARGAMVVAALSHPLFDYLTGEPGADVTRYGLALLWPMSDTRFMSGWHLFGAYHIDRLGLLGGVLHASALGPLAREIAVVGGMLGLAWRWRIRAPTRCAPKA